VATDTLTMSQLKGQLESDQVEIQNRRAQIASLQSRINEYEGRINAEPASEQQMKDLDRNYDQSKANYDDLLKKKQESQMATSSLQNLQGERFTILDAPSLPTKPDFPNRLKFCLAGLGLGLMLGAISVASFEFSDDRLHSEADIKDMLPVAVICEIPQVINPVDERKARLKTVVGWAMAVTVVVIILAGSAVSVIHG
jgi:succinoglycan biosynthesis transport protein ExoP